METKALADTELSEDSPSDYAKPNQGYCGAAGCPHSCDCIPFILFSPGSRDAAAASFGRSSASDQSVSTVFGPVGPSSLSLSLKQDRSRSRSRSHSRPRSRSLSRASSPSSRIPNPPAGSPMPSMSASIPIPNPHYELRGQLQDILRDPPISSSLPNMPTSHFPSSPLSREFRNGASSTMEAALSKDRSAYTPAGQRRDSYLHPPMTYRSGHPSPLHSNTPLFDTTLQRPLLHRTASSSSQAADEFHRGEKERRRADRATARPPPLSVPETRPTPMLRPQSHNIPIIPSSNVQSSSVLHPPMIRSQSHNMSPNPSSSSQESLAVHPPMIRSQSQNLSTTPSLGAPSSALPSPTRPQFPHPTSSQRVPTSSTSPSSSDAISRPQAHIAPSLSIPNAHQPSAHRMPRAQAHVAPALTTSSGSRPHTKPPSPLSSQHAPAYVTVPPSPVGQTARATYDVPPSRHAPEDAHTSMPTERVRRSDRAEAREGYSAATRGMSTRMLPHAMAPTSMLYVQ
ncbi:hypothetical protein B0H12DRAFT_648885 [Mycena haematopus]|nr:hypothetical protein B0H12DRAFT_648885 [Mycena haematopus]